MYFLLVMILMALLIGPGPAVGFGAVWIFLELCRLWKQAGENQKRFEKKEKEEAERIKKNRKEAEKKSDRQWRERKKHLKNKYKMSQPEYYAKHQSPHAFLAEKKWLCDEDF